MQPLNDRFVLTSGKKFYANNLIIGINPKLEIYEGYDGDLQGYVGSGPDFTEEERVEVSQYMITLWKRWGNVL